METEKQEFDIEAKVDYFKSVPEDDNRCCPQCGEHACVIGHTLYCIDGCRKKFNPKTFEEVE